MTNIGGESATAGLRTIGAFAFVLAGAIGAHYLVPGNADVAWLLTVAEKVLDGKVLYRDVLETNPPFSVYLYAPAVFGARLLSSRPETIVAAMVHALAGASLWCAARLSPRDIATGARGRSDRKSTRLNSSHIPLSRMPSSA